MTAKYIGRWLDRENVVHADNPYKRNIHCVNPWDHNADRRMYIGNKSVTAHEYGKQRNACGRSTMAFWKYLPRKTIPTCLICTLIVLHEMPTVSFTPSKSRRRRSRRRRA